jgi:hypothetical protein
MQSCLTPYVIKKVERLKPFLELIHGKNPSREEMNRPMEEYEKNIQCLRAVKEPSLKVELTKPSPCF